MTLTARQQQVLDAIRKFRETMGFGPSYRDVMIDLEISSPNGLKCHLNALKKRGLVEWDANTARSLRIVQPGVAVELHLEPTVHKSLTTQAKRAGKSLNQFCIDVLNERAAQ